MHYVFIYIYMYIYIYTYIYIYILYRYISMYYWNWPILYPNVYPSHDKHEFVNSVRMNITEPPHLGWSWDTPDMPVCEVCENMLSTPQMAILIRKVIINLYIYIHTYIHMLTKPFQNTNHNCPKTESCGQADSAWPVWDSATFSVGSFQMWSPKRIEGWRIIKLGESGRTRFNLLKDSLAQETNIPLSWTCNLSTVSRTFRQLGSQSWSFRLRSEIIWDLSGSK